MQETVFAQVDRRFELKRQKIEVVDSDGGFAVLAYFVIADYAFLPPYYRSPRVCRVAVLVAQYFKVCVLVGGLDYAGAGRVNGECRRCSRGLG